MRRILLLLVIATSLLSGYWLMAQTAEDILLSPGSGSRDAVLTVFLPPIPNAPFQAIVETEVTRHLPGGILKTSKNYRLIARDGKGRIYQEYRKMVDEGVDDGTLRRAVGHVPGTSVPGESGNVGIAGHRDSFFRGLKDIQRDDEINFATTSGSFKYVVKELSIVDPGNVAVLAPTDEPSLTMVTCYPFQYIGNAPRRFIVRATQVARVPAGRQ